MDEELIALASSINIACGAHAGNEEVMQRCVRIASDRGVAIGVHPGYEDRANFGRQPMSLDSDDIRTLVRRQLELILSIHPDLHHVKLHGALYNQAHADPTVATAVVSVLQEILPATLLYCPPGGQLARLAADAGLRVVPEGFIDRRYQEDGTLCPRSEHQALIEDFDEVVSQALKITLHHAVSTVEGRTIALQARTLCVHGDSPDAPQLLRLTRRFLEEAGVEIKAP